MMGKISSKTRRKIFAKLACRRHAWQATLIHRRLTQLCGTYMRYVWNILLHLLLNVFKICCKQLLRRQTVFRASVNDLTSKLK